MPNTSDRHKIRIFYDGACPSCVRDRQHYTHWAGDLAQQVEWVDINGRDAELKQLGIDPVLALTELHIQTPDGNIHSELDAYIILMRPVPRLKWIARLVGLPVIRPVLSKLYHWMVIRRLKRSGRMPGQTG